METAAKVIEGLLVLSVITLVLMIVTYELNDRDKD